MVKRNETRKIFVGGVQIGGQNKVVIQSMTNTKTKDVKATVEQILKLEEAGCEIKIQKETIEIRRPQKIKSDRHKNNAISRISNRHAISICINANYSKRNINNS